MFASCVAGGLRNAASAHSSLSSVAVDLTLCVSSQLLRAKHGDSDFEKEWNKKFAWFTSSKECDKITTIHGEKDSLTVHFLRFWFLNLLSICEGPSLPFLPESQYRCARIVNREMPLPPFASRSVSLDPSVPHVPSLDSEFSPLASLFFQLRSFPI